MLDDSLITIPEQHNAEGRTALFLSTPSKNQFSHYHKAGWHMQVLEPLSESVPGHWQIPFTKVDPDTLEADMTRLVIVDDIDFVSRFSVILNAKPDYLKVNSAKLEQDCAASAPHLQEAVRLLLANKYNVHILVWVVDKDRNALSFNNFHQATSPQNIGPARYNLICNINPDTNETLRCIAMALIISEFNIKNYVKQIKSRDRFIEMLEDSIKGLQTSEHFEL